MQISATFENNLPYQYLLLHQRLFILDLHVLIRGVWHKKKGHGEP